VKQSSVAETLDVLGRPGGNDAVIEKKALLSCLAVDEAERLGIGSDPARQAELEGVYRRVLGLERDEDWSVFLEQAGLRVADWARLRADFASVLAVQAHHAPRMAARVTRHRKFAQAWADRMRQLTETPT
jgi:hypothetical protein